MTYPTFFRVHICSERAQIQYLKTSIIIHLGGMILKIGFIKLFKNDEEKCNSAL